MIADVRAGKTKTIRLSRSQGPTTCSSGFRRSEIEGLELELTDVTDQGMDNVARLQDCDG